MESHEWVEGKRLTWYAFKIGPQKPQMNWSFHVIPGIDDQLWGTPANVDPYSEAETCKKPKAWDTDDGQKWPGTGKWLLGLSFYNRPNHLKQPGVATPAPKNAAKYDWNINHMI